jgi:uncharacterized protein involved in exopolysaccharide biosynthesis
MSASDEAELNISEFLTLLRKWKWPILALVVVVTTAATVAAYILPKKYVATVLVSPISDTSNSGLLGSLSSLTSQLSGLASLAGIQQSSDLQKAESVAALQSEALTEQYIRQNNLLPILYRSKWDAQRNRWTETDPSKIPTLWKANQLFKKKIRTVFTDSKSGLTTLTITWTDAATAATWANDLVKVANEYRRNKAIRESERNIAYLTTEAAKTDVVGVKQAIYGVLQSEIGKVMFARGNDEYAFKVIDPAFPPETVSSPRPLYWALIGFAGSFGLSLAFAFLRLVLVGP